MLRLITERGRPSVKIDASEEASGLALAGPNGTEEHMGDAEGRRHKSSMTLRNEDGREQVIKP